MVEYAAVAPDAGLGYPRPEDLVLTPEETLDALAGGVRTPRVFVLSAPSGTGKDTVLRAIRQRISNLHIVVACTTRGPRTHELDGSDYHFITPQAFADMRDRGQLLEDAQYANHWYGTPITPVRRALECMDDVLLKIDVQGAARVRLRCPSAVLIFLAPAGMADLGDRLMRAAAERGTVDPGDIDRRLREAQREIASIPEYDYLVVNHIGKLDATVDRLVAIIEAERSRINPPTVRV